ncbi:ABC transporter permease [Yinghuangia sp. ASG 101]|uniref:ABC transporter permease n=1 Tax=Yinghuangia sp. ASG 101 TaxID=2896848 RepID=UPI001E480B8E|nr:ABC transporter permease [Yinghuangia sp. ASG 101]UGQ09450.1 ABC transporter permease [Yinghuangia sp. ASG 101]
MYRYLLRRLLQAIPVLIGTTLLIYTMVYFLPGDPARAMAGDRRQDPVVVEMIRDKYHFNDSFFSQYWHYLTGIFQGDFGTTVRGRAVGDIMAERFPWTINLALVALLIEAVVGIVAGIFAALNRGKFFDNLVLIVTLMMISIPTFVTGFILQLLVGVEWQILPVSFNERDGFKAYIMPGYVLASLSLAYVTRLMRTSLAETMRSDYVRTAVAKGLPHSRVVMRHGVRNALIPVVTFLGADLGALMGGAIITERIFNIPGVGGQLAQSVYLRERPVVIGMVTALVLIYIVGNLIVDMLYAVLDPRIRYD